MKLFYVLDYVFHRTPDGRTWTDTSYDAGFWSPYLKIYSHVTVISRVKEARAQEIGWKEVESHLVSVAPVPHYRGAVDYLRKARLLSQALRDLFNEDGAVILRVPSNLARCAARVLDRMGKPYAVDVVGDPFDSLAPGVVEMPGRPIFRRLFAHVQRRICRRAIGVAYVASTLRKRYPETPGVLNLVCSDVRLDAEWLAARPRRHPWERRTTHLLTVATLSQPYKGIDILLTAVRRCRDRGALVDLTIVGSGRYREELERQAAQLGLARSVSFTGSIAWGPQLMAQFDAADIFVLPSRVEAMPRALLEAMARALPIIATRVGAIPEILEADDIVQPGDAEALTTRLLACTGNPGELDRMSSRNLARVESFASSQLESFRHHFHYEIRQQFERHSKRRRASLTEPAAA